LAFDTEKKRILFLQKR